MKFNPFTPGSIVGPSMFAGRGEELMALNQALFQTKNGNPHHFLIHGERGIGKSSLLLCVKMLARGRVTPVGQAAYRFLVIDAEIEPSTTYEGFTEKIGGELTRELRQCEAVRSAAKGVWDFLSRWEVLGVKYDRTATSQRSAVLEELCETLCQTAERTKDDFDGILIMIDEADNASESAHLGEWIKVFTERLSKRACDRICVGMSGISTIIDKLRESHESSPRILNHMLLQPLAQEERLEIVQAGLKVANEKSTDPVTIKPDAADWISKFSEGFPHFVQQYAYSAFETDNDNVIDLDDVHYGAYKENGALDQLGSKYFEVMYRAQINSDEYRKVLQAIAESPDRYVSRKYIQDTTKLKDTTLGNAIRTLASKQIILPFPGKQGLYRLPSDSFGAWIRAQARRDVERQAKKEF